MLTLVSQLAGLRRDQGRYVESETLYTDVLERTRNVRGKDHSHTLSALNHLAGLYMTQERYSDAEALYAECLELRRAKLGESHEETIESLGALAVVYMRQGRYSEAEPMLLKRFEKSKGGDIVTFDLGELYERQGRYAESEAKYKKCRLLKGFIQNTRNTQLALGRLYTTQNRFADAKSMYTDCLDGIRMRYGEGHVYNLTPLREFAKLDELRGEFDNAEVSYKKCVELSTRKLGKEHPESVTAHNNLIAFYKSRGRHSDLVWYN
jgi:tetratricopeptide (TPR) repeat protein